MTIDQRAFRHAMGQFASGVTVVTTHDGDVSTGITVSSFASLSLDPPLVLICIDHRGRSHEALADADMFAVNILAEHQEQVAGVFASRAEDKFAYIAHTFSANGLPLLDDVLATVECRKVNAVPGGDHTIFVGEVVSIATHDRRPLVYHASRFGQFAEAEPLEAVPLVRPQASHAVAAIA